MALRPFDSRYPILVAEDNHDDVQLLKLALGKAGIPNFLQAVSDGREVVDYLAGRNEFVDRGRYPFPEIIMLDIKMPRMNGFEVLHWIKRHPKCAIIPTIILSGSAQENDVKKAYQLGANAYLHKPVGLDEFSKLLRLTFEFWASCLRPPGPSQCED